MKPKTKEQREVYAHFRRHFLDKGKMFVKPLTDRQLNKLSSSYPNTHYVKNSDVPEKEARYVAFSSKSGKWQIYAIYQVVIRRYVRKPMTMSAEAVGCIYFDTTNNNLTLVGRYVNGLCRSYYKYVYCGDYEIRPISKYKYTHGCCYSSLYFYYIGLDFVYYTSRHKDLPEFMHNETRLLEDGVVDTRNHYINYSSSQYETMSKRGENAIAEYILEKGVFPKDKWQSLLCALRHKLTIGENGNKLDLWLDHYRLLQNLGMDTHNPQFVAPADLEKAHTEVVEIMNRKIEKKRLAEEREREIRQYQMELQRQKELEDRNEKYRKWIERYSHISIAIADGVTAKPLLCINDFLEEGTAMHHCVYQCAYYDRRDTMILSARNEKGERLETIEVGVKDGKVVQSRGKYNQSTSLHEKIVECVEESFLNALKLSVALYKESLKMKRKSNFKEVA